MILQKINYNDDFAEQFDAEGFIREARGLVPDCVFSVRIWNFTGVHCCTLSGWKTKEKREEGERSQTERGKTFCYNYRTKFQWTKLSALENGCIYRILPPITGDYWHSIPEFSGLRWRLSGLIICAGNCRRLPALTGDYFHLLHTIGICLMVCASIYWRMTSFAGDYRYFLISGKLSEDCIR